jgi:hypothetical protein
MKLESLTRVPVKSLRKKCANDGGVSNYDSGWQVGLSDPDMWTLLDV